MKQYFTIVATALALSAGAASAATFTPTFDTPSFSGSQFDVESDPSFNAYYSVNFGITIENSYLYLDSRDTFDGLGIASGPVSLAGSTSAPRQFGRINFLDTTDIVTLDYWALETATYEAYSASDTLIDSRTVPAEISTMTLSGGIISYVLFSADKSAFATVSGLTYNYDGTTDGVNNDIPPVPLPAGFPLLAAGLIGLGALARRKKAA